MAVVINELDVDVAPAPIAPPPAPVTAAAPPPPEATTERVLFVLEHRAEREERLRAH